MSCSASEFSGFLNSRKVSPAVTDHQLWLQGEESNDRKRTQLNRRGVSVELRRRRENSAEPERSECGA